jgi:alpha-galactosidase
MGNPEARRWITDKMSEMITSEGVDIFREDYNISPIRYWRAADAPDRQGMTEIKYIEGFYAFWDELLERHPGLVIDNCASGGQRIDIETMRRSIPLWRSDLQCSTDYDPVGSQSQTLGISYWVPIHAAGCTRTGDTYDFRSILSSGATLCWTNPERPDFPIDWARRCAEEAALVRPFFYGDLYPLTGYSRSEEVWLVYQLHRQDMKQGAIIAYRRAECPYPTAHFKLRGLKSKAVYRIKNLNTKRAKKATGAELMNEGLDLQLTNTPDSLVLLYEEE